MPEYSATDSAHEIHILHTRYRHLQSCLLMEWCYSNVAYEVLLKGGHCSHYMIFLFIFLFLLHWRIYLIAVSSPSPSLLALQMAKIDYPESVPMPFFSFSDFT